MVAAALEQAPPNGDTQWSTRSMARSAGMSPSTVLRIWRTFGLKPHVVQTWKLSTHPQFIDKVRDAVGLYLAPPENALVLCVDEVCRSDQPQAPQVCPRSVTEFENGIRKWINQWNKDPKPFVWVKTADEIPGTLAACGGLITESGR